MVRVRTAYHSLTAYHSHLSSLGSLAASSVLRPTAAHREPCKRRKKKDAVSDPHARNA